MMAAMDVDPEVLLFTQDSIARKFRAPYQDQRIDDTVDSILAGKKAASEFPRLEVVQYEGHLWSLDNRRLWVFRKARVPTITVNLVRYNHHPRFADLIENKPELKMKLQQKGYWPKVRGRCRQKCSKPAGNYSCPPSPPPRQVYVALPAPPPRAVYRNEITSYNTGARVHPIMKPEQQVLASRPKPDVIIQVDLDKDGDESAACRSITKGLVIGSITAVGLIILRYLWRLKPTKGVLSPWKKHLVRMDENRLRILSGYRLGRW